VKLLIYKQALLLNFNKKGGGILTASFKAAKKTRPLTQFFEDEEED
jgi:hypothetical protein